MQYVFLNWSTKCIFRLNMLYFQEMELYGPLNHRIKIYKILYSCYLP